MSTEYFTASGYPGSHSGGTSVTMRTELLNIEAGFGKLTALAGNAAKFPVINAAGTAQIAATYLQESALGVGVGGPAVERLQVLGGEVMVDNARGYASKEFGGTKCVMLQLNVSNQADHGPSGSCVGHNFYTSGVLRGQFDATGNFFVARTGTALANVVGHALLPAGTQVVESAGRSRQANRFGSDGVVDEFYRQSVSVGTISVTAAATTYATSSDERLKTKIVDAPEQGAFIDSLRVRTFEFKNDPDVSVTGFIAQELHTVAPLAVKAGTTGDDMSETWGVDPSKLVAAMVREIQSLRARVAALEA